MSDSVHSRSSTDGESPTVPRATIHKKILDAAAEEPDAPMEAIANRVSGASLGLVEQVLDKYGDPAEETSTEPETGDDLDQHTSSMALLDQDADGDGQPPVELSDLTEKQRETIHAIAENPHATQTDLADRFDVSAATINNRVNSIPGFEWKLRHQFIDTMLDENERSGGDDGVAPPPDEFESRLADLEERLENLERTTERETGDGQVVGDPELLHKVIHASMDSDRITEDEELRILEELLS